MDVNIYISIDSASMRVSEKWYGYVMECEIRGKQITREGFGNTEGTYHQASLVALISAMERMKQPCEVRIHAEDDFILNMIEKNMVRWAENGFTSAKGKPVANQEEWIRLWNAASEHLIQTVKGTHQYSSWLISEIERRKNDA